MAVAVVTGASSFVGAHLALAFAESGWQVIATHSRPVAAYDGIQAIRLRAVAERARLAPLDIADEAAIAGLLEQAAPSLWLHHAGHAADYGGFDYDLARGLAINAAVLPALYRRLAGSGCGVVMTGSSMEYSDCPAGNSEQDCALPDTPYGLAKLTQTLAARQLAAHHGVATRVARLYIPFGRGDNPAKLLPQVAAALAAGQPVELSPCLQQRDFVGIRDVCAGYLALAGTLADGGFDILNLSGGEPVALAELLRRLAELVGADAGLLRFGARPMRPGEPQVSFGRNEKARAMLSWSPRPLAQALAEDLLIPHPLLG